MRLSFAAICVGVLAGAVAAWLAMLYSGATTSVIAWGEVLLAWVGAAVAGGLLVAWHEGRSGSRD